MRTQRMLELALVTLGLAVRGVAMTVEAGPDFARDVQPILAVACVRCHASATQDTENEPIRLALFA